MILNRRVRYEERGGEKKKEKKKRLGEGGLATKLHCLSRVVVRFLPVDGTGRGEGALRL